MNSSKVSVIMPAFNDERFIALAIDSVLEQTYQDLELLICDDGSNDNTVKIIKEKMVSDKRIFLYKNKYNKGAPGSRNTCLENSSGRYIAFLDSDDFWYPFKLEDQISLMRKKNSCFCIGSHDVIDEKNKILHSILAPSIMSPRLMRMSNFIPCLTAIYDSKILKKVKQPDIVKRNDYALWLVMFNDDNFNEICSIDKPVAAYRRNSYGLSSNKFDALKYFSLCLYRYGDCNIYTTFIYTIIYTLIILIKKGNPLFYNFLIKRFINDVK